MPHVIQGVEFTDLELSPAVIVSTLTQLIGSGDEQDSYENYMKLISISCQVHGEAATYGFLAAAAKRHCEKHPEAAQDPRVQNIIQTAQMRACQ